MRPHDVHAIQPTIKGRELIEHLLVANSSADPRAGQDGFRFSAGLLRVPEKWLTDAEVAQLVRDGFTVTHGYWEPYSPGWMIQMPKKPEPMAPPEVRRK